MRCVLEDIVIFWLRTGSDLIDFLAYGDESVAKAEVISHGTLKWRKWSYRSSSCFDSDSVGSISQHLLNFSTVTGSK